MFDVSIEDDIYSILVNSKNATTPTIKQSDILSLEKTLDQIIKQKKAKGLLFYNKAKTNFCHGLDPRELVQIKSKEKLEIYLDSYYRVFEKILSLEVPKVALIRGNCFSFGLELILSCDVRLAADNASFAFHNLASAMTTAFFSSKRSSKLIGLKNTLDLVLSTREISSYSAEKKGLIDEVCPETFLLEQAKKYFSGEKKPSSPPSNWGVEATPIGRKLMYKRARALIDEKTKGFYPSYFNALKALYLCYEKDLKETAELEKKLFTATFLTQQSQSVLHLFYAKHKILEQKKSEKKKPSKTLFLCRRIKPFPHFLPRKRSPCKSSFFLLLRKRRKYLLIAKKTL